MSADDRASVVKNVNPSTGETGFDPERHWEEMHKSNRGITAVGYSALGPAFNTWMYRVRRRVLRRALRRAEIRVDGADVLEIGAGTGFYVQQWLELGASSVLGLDLSETAVASLRRAFPAASFLRADVADLPAEFAGRHYDVVSAFDVLFHIVDDARFNRSIRNLAELTRPGGHLLFSDNFVHGQAGRSRDQVSRSLTEIEAAVLDANLEIVDRIPMFVLMNAPVDAPGSLLQHTWKVAAGLSSRSEVAGFLVGALLYPAELALTAAVAEGPSTELMICRKPGATAKTPLRPRSS